jgi:hypothetical protein
MSVGSYVPHHILVQEVDEECDRLNTGAYKTETEYKQAIKVRKRCVTEHRRLMRDAESRVFTLHRMHVLEEVFQKLLNAYCHEGIKKKAFLVANAKARRQRAYAFKFRSQAWS